MKVILSKIFKLKILILLNKLLGWSVKLGVKRLMDGWSRMETKFGSSNHEVSCVLVLWIYGYDYLL